MTDKELSRLRRTELLELLIAQGKEYAALQEKLAQAEQAAQKREMTVREAGSMADAAVEINDLIGTAQRAVDLYTENIYRVCLEQETKATQLLADARIQAEKAVTDAEERVEWMMNGARDRALEIIHEAQEEARKLLDEAAGQANAIQAEAEQVYDELLLQAEKDAAYLRSKAAGQPLQPEIKENTRRHPFWKRS